MPTSSPSALFISHSAEDKPLADALCRALNELLRASETTIEIRYSSSAEKGPQGGAAWRDWIEEQVVAARSALVLLTRESTTRPWPLWEAGACRGVALLRRSTRAEDDAEDTPHVTTIRYGLKDEECPDPLRAGQIISGTDPERVSELLLQILDRHGMSGREMGRAGQRIEVVVEGYLQRVEQAMLMAPALVSEPNIQEWLARLDRLVREGRWSELEGYQRWLNLSFGRDADSKHLPIDVRLHRRLGEYHLQQMRYDDAIEQLTLARRSAPRDIYTLRRLGEARIKRAMETGSSQAEMQGEKAEIKDVMERIETLDREAIAANPETAALYGKYLRRVLGQLDDAIAVYRGALDRAPDSYYLADLLGQTQLEAGHLDAAHETYETVLRILDRIADDDNIWTLASRATALIVEGNRTEAEATLRSLMERKPTRDERKTIRDSLRELARRLPQPVSELDELLGILLRNP